MREIKLWLFQHYEPDNGHRKYYIEDTVKVPEELQVYDIIEHIKNSYTGYLGMDIVLAFSPDGNIGYPCLITYQERSVH